jgi:hypothetical protein
MYLRIGSVEHPECIRCPVFYLYPVEHTIYHQVDAAVSSRAVSARSRRPSVFSYYHGFYVSAFYHTDYLDLATLRLCSRQTMMNFFIHGEEESAEEKTFVWSRRRHQGGLYKGLC